MSPELTRAIPQCNNLPTPTGIAARIIALAQDPDAELGAATRLIGQDPALSVRILRLANSPLFASRRRSENLQQAINKLGLHPTLQLALGFKLLGNLQGSSQVQQQHDQLWRRSLIAAIACRALGETLRVNKPDELLLAGLIQDIGALFLLQQQPAAYCSLLEQARGDNRQLLTLEQQALGSNHALLGAELARHWDLPGYLIQAIADSELPPDGEPGITRCVQLSGPLADLWLDPDNPEATHRLLPALASNHNIAREHLDAILARMQQLLPEAAWLFDTPLSTPAHIQALLEQARDVSELRQLRMAQEAEVLRERSDVLERRANELSSMANRDALTGTINRGHFDQCLSAAFDTANAQQRPLSIAFIDLDDFKKINDRHGHLTGDDVLKAVAAHLKRHVRTLDTVARYGGEEFVIIFPDTPLEGARATIDRVLRRLWAQPVAEVDGQPLHVSFSAGIACHQPAAPFASAHALLDAADRALYRSKGQGRNQVAIHQPAAHDNPA